MSERPTVSPAPATPLTEAALAGWPLPDAGSGADKEARGRVLIVAGSHEMPGAALLAAVAALRVGAGKLAIAAPDRVAQGLALAIPESRVIGLAETHGTTLLVGGDLSPVKRAFDKDVDGGVVDLPGVMSRKKQVAPVLLGAL